VLIKAPRKFTKLRNVVTGEVIASEPLNPDAGRNHTSGQEQSAFKVRLLPHSYQVLTPETDVHTAER
jgi:hypothetical protein